MRRTLFAVGEARQRFHIVKPRRKERSMSDPIVFPPTSDSKWVEWTQSFLAAVTPNPQGVQLTPAQVAELNTAFLAFQSALATSNAPTTRTRPAVAAKNQARADLRGIAGHLVATVRSNLAISNEQLLELGIKPRTQRQPVPPPAFAPDIDIVSVNGNRVTIRLHNSQTVGRRRRPVGVAGAAVFSHVGPSAPEDPTLYRFEGNVTKTEVVVELPSSVQPGTKVWFTAFWYSPTAASGPGAVPVSAVTQWPMQVAPVSLANSTRKAA
jgi:hypothetical protein